MANEENRPRGTASGSGSREGREWSDRSAEDRRSTLERIIPELLRWGIEAGRGRLKQTDEALRNVSDSVFAREVAAYILSQLGDFREALSKAMTHEFERFLRRADLASELRKTLSGMTVEAKVQLRFYETEGGELRTEADVEGLQDGSQSSKEGP